MPMSPAELVALARQSDVTTAQLRADVDALRAKLERLGGPTCPNCRFPAMGPLWWSPRLADHVCAQCALVHQGEGDAVERVRFAASAEVAGLRTQLQEATAQREVWTQRAFDELRSHRATVIELITLRAAVRRYLEARDAAQPEAEKVARDEIERML